MTDTGKHRAVVETVCLSVWIRRICVRFKKGGCPHRKGRCIITEPHKPVHWMPKPTEIHNTSPSAFMPTLSQHTWFYDLTDWQAESRLFQLGLERSDNLHVSKYPSAGFVTALRFIGHTDPSLWCHAGSSVDCSYNYKTIFFNNIHFTAEGSIKLQTRVFRCQLNVCPMSHQECAFVHIYCIWKQAQEQVNLSQVISLFIWLFFIICSVLQETVKS